MEISSELQINIQNLNKAIYSSDIEIIDIKLAKKNGKLIFISNIIDKLKLGELLLKPILNYNGKVDKNNIFNLILSPKKQKLDSIEKVSEELVKGSAILIIDGINLAFSCDVIKPENRAIQEPPTSTVIKGPREGFNESLPININLIRKKLRTPDLVFEQLDVGKYSKTAVAICYIKGIVDTSLIKKVKQKISNINTDAILDSSYISKFLCNKTTALFKQVGNTEKPDILASKILEGRIAILVDGSPIALTIPYLLLEDFQSPSDYYSSPFSTSIARIIRVVSVMISLYLASRSDKTFTEILQETFSKKEKNIILFLFVIFFLLKSIMPIFETQSYVQQTLYITMPKTINFLPFFALSFYACLKKLRLMGRISDFLFFTTLTGYIFMLVLSIEGTDFGAILPIGANGFTNIYKGSFHSLTWFSDGVYVLFLIGTFKREKHTNIKIIISFFISALLIIIFTIIFYGIFLQNSKNQPFALTETTKYSNIINNTERFDYFGIMLILISDIFAMVLPLFFACKTLENIFETEKSWIFSLIVNLIVFTITFILKNYFASIKAFILNYASYYYIFTSIILTTFILLSFIVKNSKRSMMLKEKLNEIS